MQKVIEKTAQNLAILDLIPAEILKEVPAEKKEEFQWGLLFFLQKEKPALYQAFEQPQTVCEATQKELTEAIRSFEAMVKERHHKQIERRRTQA